jgi:hypothetical protein
MQKLVSRNHWVRKNGKSVSFSIEIKTPLETREELRIRKRVDEHWQLCAYIMVFYDILITDSR